MPFLTRARRCEIRGADHGRLTGKRIAIKDSIAVACMPMMNGSHALEGFTPSYDATVVSRVLDAGKYIVMTSCEAWAQVLRGHIGTIGWGGGVPMTTSSAVNRIPNLKLTTTPVP